MAINVMALDIEMNQPSKKIIQIGAAAFEARSGLLLEKISLYINPQEKIEPFITKLTGITDQDVSNGLSIIEGYEELRNFHKKHKCFRNPLVWGSGLRNDAQAIFEQTQMEGENFMGFRVLDVKTIFQSIKIYNNGAFGTSLEETCRKLGIGFEGSAHDATNDAVNTFRVWHALMKRFDDK